MTRKEALENHRKMWTAMQKELGDNPIWETRESFKTIYVLKATDGVLPINNCYLCEYATVAEEHLPYCRRVDCKRCPIDWGNSTGNCMGTHVDYRCSHISEILSLPERVVVHE